MQPINQSFISIKNILIGREIMAIGPSSGKYPIHPHPSTRQLPAIEADNILQEAVKIAYFTRVTALFAQKNYKVLGILVVTEGFLKTFLLPRETHDLLTPTSILTISLQVGHMTYETLHRYPQWR